MRKKPCHILSLYTVSMYSFCTLYYTIHMLHIYIHNTYYIYVCVHIYIHTYIYINTYVYAYIIYICINAYVYVYMYVCMYVYIYVYMSMINVYCMYTYIYIYIYIYLLYIFTVSPATSSLLPSALAALAADPLVAKQPHHCPKRAETKNPGGTI